MSQRNTLGVNIFDEPPRTVVSSDLALIGGASDLTVLEVIAIKTMRCTCLASS